MKILFIILMISIVASKNNEDKCELIMIDNKSEICISKIINEKPDFINIYEIHENSQNIVMMMCLIYVIVFILFITCSTIVLCCA